MSVLEFINRAIKTLPKHRRGALYFNGLFRILLASLDVIGVLFLGVAAALASGTTIESASLTGQLLKFFGIPDNGQGLIIFGLLALFFFVVKAAAAIFLSQWAANTLARLETDFSVLSFESLFVKGMRDFTDEGVSKIQRTLLHSTKMIYGYGMAYFSVAVGEVALIVTISVVLGILNPLLLLTLGLYLGAVGWFTNKFVGGRLSKLSSQFEQSSISAARSIAQGLGARRELITSGKTSFMIGIFREQREVAAKSEGQTSVFSSLPRYLLEGALMLGFTGFLIWRGIQPTTEINISMVTIFVAGMFRIVSSMLPLQGALGVLTQSAASADLALEMLESIPSGEPGLPSENKEKRISPHESAPSLEFSDVSFGHQGTGKYLFSNLNATVFANQMLLISGASGTGKSTLAEMIIGLRTDYEGKITIDRTEVRDSFGGRLASVGYVPQRPEIVDGSIEENISFERGTASDQRLLQESLIASGLDEVVDALAYGSKTDLSEQNGIKFSGGQLQRLGIARVVYQSSKLLVLDEPVSSLDSRASLEIIKLINRLKSSRTIVVISHKYLDEFEWDTHIKIGDKTTDVRSR